MDIEKVLTEAEEIIDTVDKWDDAVINAMEKVASLSFMPPGFKTAVKIVKEWEPELIKDGKATVDFLKNAFYGVKKAEPTGKTGTEKLEIATSEALAEALPQEVKEVVDMNLMKEPCFMDKTTEVYNKTKNTIDKVVNIANSVIKIPSVLSEIF